MEVRPKQRELSAFERYYTSRVITSGREQREKPVVRYVPGSESEPALPPAPETVTEAPTAALTNAELLDQLEEPPDDFSLDDAAPVAEAAPAGDGDRDSDFESEGESETTASEMGESELGVAPAPAPEAPPSLKPKKRPYIEPHRVKKATAREDRGWNQLMSQGAKKEKAEERLARGMGTSYVVPTEETNDKATGTLAKITISQVLPTIKLPALKGPAPPKPEEAAAEVEVGEVKAVRIKLAGTARPLRRALPAKRKAPEVEEEEVAA